MHKRWWVATIAWVGGCIVSAGAQLLPTLPESNIQGTLAATLLENTRQMLRATAVIDHTGFDSLHTPLDATAQLQAARLDIMQGYYSLAHLRLAQYLSQRPLLPFRAQAHYLRGVAYYQERGYLLAARQFDTAAQYATISFEQTQDSQYLHLRREALYWKAIAFSQLSAYEAAEQSFRELLHTGGEYEDDAYAGLAAIAEMQGDYPRALTYYDSILVVAPKGAWVITAHIRAAQQLLLLRQPRQALQRLAAASDMLSAAQSSHLPYLERQQLPPHTTALVQLLYAEALSQLRQFDQAVERYHVVIGDTTLQGSALRWQAYLGLGWAELNRARYSVALAAYRTVLDSLDDRLSLQRAQALLYIGVALERSGDVLAAIEHYDALISDETFPLRAQAYLERGQIEYERRQYTTAAALFDRASRAASDPATMLRSLLLRGRAEFDQQRWQAALRTFTEVVTTAQNFSPTVIPNLSLLLAEAILYRGIAYCIESRYVDAIADLGQVVSQFPTHPRRDEALLWLAESYERINMLDNAVEALQLLLNTYPTSAYREDALYNLGWAQFRMQRFEDAKTTFDRLLSEFPRSRYALDVTLRKADILYLTKKYADAVRLYRQVVKTTPTSDDGEYAHFQLGQSLYRLGDYNNAVEQFRHFVRTFPESPIADDALYNIAWIRMLQGRWTDAIEMFETLLRSYRQSELAPYARFYIAQCTYNSGQYVRAIDLYRQFLAEYPSTPMTGQAIEAIQDAYIALGQDSLAVAVAREYIEKDPASEHSAQIQLRTTDIFVRNRDYENAIREYERFIEQYPNSRYLPEALYGLLKSSLAVGREHQAVQILRRLEQDYSSSEYTELALSDLATTYQERAMLDRADSLFAIIMQRYPNRESFAKAAYERARIALVRGDTSKACALWFEATRGSGEYAYQAYYRLGMWYRERGRSDSARAMFRPIIHYTDNPALAAEAAYRIGELWQQEGNCIAASDTFTIVLDRFEGTEDWYTLSLLGTAECAEKLGNIEKARQLYQTILILRPDDDFGRTAAARRRRLEKKR
ncbi:MAG: tetratricopeptide repeat protein [Candidatus Kapabacteria bacterium]|nr:tetratricopeptide repeat protein [Candidatus Kapabacteria bacterium]